MFNHIKNYYKETNKGSLTIYIFLRLFVIVCMVLAFINRNYQSVFFCFLTLLLFTIPYFIDRKLKITLPSLLESIIYLFIFSAEILGELGNFYGHIQGWDTMLHTINGFICAGIGFSLIDILNRTERFHIKLTPVFVALVSFCFSMTIGVLWEFFEFGSDYYLLADMQKDRVVERISSVEFNPEGKNEAIVIDDIEYTIIYSKDDSGKLVETKIDGGYLDIGIIDTMKDLFVNFIGAIVFSFIGFLYIKNRDEYKFAENFIPKLRK